MTYRVARNLGSYAPLVKYGMGYGAVAAMILSWDVNHSILWMLIDGWLNWIYVIFFALFRG